MGLYTSIGIETKQMNCEAVHVRFVSRPIEVYNPYTSTEQDFIHIFVFFLIYLFIYFLDKISYFSKS